MFTIPCLKSFSFSTVTLTYTFGASSSVTSNEYSSPLPLNVINSELNTMPRSTVTSASESFANGFGMNTVAVSPGLYESFPAVSCILLLSSWGHAALPGPPTQIKICERVRPVEESLPETSSMNVPALGGTNERRARPSGPVARLLLLTGV